jgi:urease accessory protein
VNTPGIKAIRPVRGGQATLTVEMVFGESTVTSVAASSPMKMLTPVARGRSVWAFASSFGGGLVAGDQTELDLSVRSGARCFFSTQSSTKVYRNPAARPCSHRTKAVLDADALLVFTPEPVQAFAGAYYTQRQEFHLAAGAGLVLLDWYTSGRAARGERWAFSHFESRNDVFIGGQRVLVDSLLLSSPEVPERMGRFDCLATLLLVGTPLKAVTETLLQTLAVMPVEPRAAQICSVSPVRDGVLVRLAGIKVENIRRELHHHLGFVSELLGDDPWARKW